MAGIFATAGAIVSIGQVQASQTTDFVEADFDVHSWTAIAWCENMGAFGDASEAITFDSIDATRRQKLKGVRDAGTMDLVFGVDYEDDGQAALRAAEATIDDYAIKVEFNDGPASGTNSIRYFIAKVMSVREQLDTANNVVKLMASLGINSNIVSVAAAA